MCYIARLITLLFISYCAFLNAEPDNIHLLKKQIAQYQSSGEYLREIDKVIAKAKTLLKKEIESNKNKAHPRKLALVLDIDETSLSNFQKIIERDYSNHLKQIHKEILAADAPAIIPTLRLYNFAIRNGVSVFFVTGRTNQERQATIKNLHRAGYHRWTNIYFKPNHYHKSSIVPFKTAARKNIVDGGYTILASIGDQRSDIIGGYALQGFKLPNPMYYIY